MLNKLLLRKNSFALFLIFLPVALTILFPRPSQGAEMPTYQRLQPVTSFINGAIDVATDQSDNLYVADTVYDSVEIFQGDGQHIETLRGFSFPISVAVNSAGNIYVGNNETGNVEVYDSNHSFLHKLGSGDGEFSRPNDIAISAAGQIYVVDQGADVVKVYNSNGTYSTSFGSSGNGDGEFHNPVSIAIDEVAQELIVLDHQLLLDDTAVWIDGARIQVFDMAGVFKRGFTKMAVPTLYAGDLYKPQRVAVDEQSRLYVTDSLRNVVQVYDSLTGTYLGALYDLQDPLRVPVGITLAANNLLYIANRGTGQVEAYQLSEPVQGSSPSILGISGGVNTSLFSDTPTPQLSITPTPSALSFISKDGSIPASKLLSITNIGSGTLTWTASAYPSWIVLDKTSGTAPEKITVAVDISSLAPGEYMGAITVTGDGALSSPSHIGVTLTIVQSGTEEKQTPDNDNGNKKTEFPWILFKHLFMRR